MATLQELHTVPRTATTTEFDTLPEDAPEEVRQRLAERFAPEVRRQQEEHLSLADLEATSRRGKAVAESVVIQSLLSGSCRRWVDAPTDKPEHSKGKDDMREQ